MANIDVEKFRFREWAPALRGAGIAHRRVDDLRHTYASWALAMDVPPAKLALMMGTSIAQLEDTYSPLPEERRPVRLGGR